MERGAPLQWLSAFPGESEFLYPPLTYLKPTGVEETAQAAPEEPAEVTFAQFLKMMKSVEERGVMGDIGAFLTSLF